MFVIQVELEPELRPTYLINVCDITLTMTLIPSNVTNISMFCTHSYLCIPYFQLATLYKVLTVGPCRQVLTV
jgi:hypothetical protein